LVQRRRDKKAAKKFFRKLLKGLTYVPRVIVTNKLKSYGAAKREILPGVEHRQHRYLNNRAENSHQPTRQREQRMQELAKRFQIWREITVPAMTPEGRVRRRTPTSLPGARFGANKLTMPLADRAVPHSAKPRIFELEFLLA
jgi:transposase-like protein